MSCLILLSHSNGIATFYPGLAQFISLQGEISQDDPDEPEEENPDGLEEEKPEQNENSSHARRHNARRAARRGGSA